MRLGLIIFRQQEFPGKNKGLVIFAKTGCSELSNPFFIPFHLVRAGFCMWEFNYR